MAALEEGTTLQEVLKWEQENRYSRDKVVIASGQNLVMGEVVGKITADGKYAVYNQDAVDGTEVAAGFVIADYDASAADLDGIAIVRDAQVIEANLVWPSDIDAGEQAQAMIELAALGIIGREEA